MTKGVRFWELFVVLSVFVASNGCGHKPAYSDVDANRPSRTQNNNSEDKAGTTPTSPAAAPATGATQPPDSATSAQRYKTPKFMDQATGAIKDLPNYPRSTRASIQIGPNQGLNVMTLVLQTGDSMDLITAFYQKAFKDYQWTVIDKVIDPELSEWTLKKGEENGLRIQVRKDPTLNKRDIVIVRGEKLEESSK